MSRPQAALAAARFGLGPRPGELAEIGADPRGWLNAQIGRQQPPEIVAASSGAARAAELLAARAAGDRALIRMLRESGRAAYIADALARTRKAAESDTPFVERLVHFWSNHFTVSAARPAVANLCGPFETEAIRPNVLGRFEDLLTAAIRHPAMLIYLDNAVSVGPNSRAGRLRGRGLNENLARELLELHTLGVDGGYGQDDVHQLALILTGWTIGRPNDPQPGAFRFFPAIHEPGAKSLLGTRIPEGGIAEGEAALAALARHPATARHVATRLVRHFVDDDPPAAAVGHLTRVFGTTGGDLAAMSTALIALEQAWTTPLAKIRTPNDLVIATLRVLGADGEARAGVGRPGGAALASLRLLGQLPWMAPSPAGWPDTAAAWTAPEQVMRRVDWGVSVARRTGGRMMPRALAEATIAPLATAGTMTAIDRAPSIEDGLALVLVSPEFQRR